MFFWIGVLVIPGLSSACSQVSTPSCALESAPIRQTPVKVPDSLSQEIAQVFEASRKCWEGLSAPQMHGEMCQIERIAFVPKLPSPSSEGQRVLVIDSGMKIAAFTRYHKRVLEFLVVDENGFYSPIKEAIELPRWMRIILRDLLGDRYSNIPTHLLTGHLPSMDMAMRKYPSYRDVEPESEDTWKAKHGGMTFSTIAEYSPNAEFVLAPFGLPGESSYCALRGENLDKSFTKIGEYFRNQATSLKKWITDRKIDFINLSAHTNGQKLSQSFEEICGFRPSKNTIDKLISIQYTQFIKPLSEIPGVRLVQATENEAPNPVEVEGPGSLMTCGRLKNRILVGTVGEAYSQLPVEGKNNFYLLTKHQRNLEPCVDLFINAGVECKEPLGVDRATGPNPVFIAYDGLVSASPLNGLVCSWSTSAAAPVALSYLIYLKNSLPAPVSTEQLLWCANHGGKGKLKDPALHRQFESYRLGRME